MNRLDNFFYKLFHSKLFILVLILIVSFSGFNLFVQFSKSKTVENKVDELKRGIEETEKENINLAELVDYFKSDLFVEKEARIKLGFKKQGESVVIVEDTASDQKIKNLPQSEFFVQKEKKSNIKLWLEYFFAQNIDKGKK